MLIQELGLFQPTTPPKPAASASATVPQSSPSAQVSDQVTENETDEGEDEGQDVNGNEGDDTVEQQSRRSRLGLPAKRRYDEGYNGRQRAQINNTLEDDGHGRIGIIAAPSASPSNATKPFNIDTVHGRRPLVPPPVHRTPLLTYSPPATLFAGRGGEEFARFFNGKQSSVSRLLVQFYSANATYDTAEALFGNGTEAAPGRARIAALTGWDANKIIVQKPLQENQPGHVGAEQLGHLFCEAGQRVNGLSVWRIDYRDTAISNEYLAAVRGYKCGNRPSSPPPNPTPSQTPSASASVLPSAAPSVACPVE